MSKKTLCSCFLINKFHTFSHIYESCVSGSYGACCGQRCSDHLVRLGAQLKRGGCTEMSATTQIPVQPSRAHNTLLLSSESNTNIIKASGSVSGILLKQLDYCTQLTDVWNSPGFIEFMHQHTTLEKVHLKSGRGCDVHLHTLQGKGS